MVTRPSGRGAIVGLAVGVPALVAAPFTLVLARNQPAAQVFRQPIGTQGLVVSPPLVAEVLMTVLWLVAAVGAGAAVLAHRHAARWLDAAGRSSEVPVP